VIDHDGNSVSSIKDSVNPSQKFTKLGSKKGKTRAQAIKNLNVPQAELLHTGEIKLPNGKM
jgi:hypothetical protein